MENTMSATTGQKRTSFNEGQYSVAVTQYLSNNVIGDLSECTGTIKQCLKCIENLYYHERDWAFAYSEPYIEVNLDYVFATTKTISSAFSKFNKLQDKLKLFIEENKIDERYVSYYYPDISDWEENCDDWN